MPPKDQSAKTPLPNVTPAERAEEGKQQVEAMFEVQH